LAGVLQSAAAANSEPGQLFVRPTAGMKGGAAEKLASEGTSINDNPERFARDSRLSYQSYETDDKSGPNRITQPENSTPGWLDFGQVIHQTTLIIT
jgi:hypothetical protein